MEQDPAMTVGVSRKRKRPPTDVLVVPGADDLRLGGFSNLRSGQSFDLADDSRNADYPIPNFASVYSRMRDPNNGLSIMVRRYRLISYPKCFIGSEAVTWMEENLKISRQEAVDMGQKLIEAGIMHHVTQSEPFTDGYFFYRFQEDHDTGNVLNMKRVWDASIPARGAVQVSEELLTRLACLCEEYRFCNLSLKDGQKEEDKGSTTPTQSPNLLTRRFSAAASDSGHLGDPDIVNYERLKNSEEFRNYCVAASELQRVHLAGLSHEEKVAMFTNLYNLLCLHAHVVYGAPNSLLRRWMFFRMLSYRVAGLDLTLDDIEHGMLRGNKRAPMIKFMQQLRPSDPKCQHILTQRDGRIHFVISAGTRSDPPIRIMEAASCEEQLHEATEEFLDKSVRVDMEKRTVTLPRIFYWYADDFISPEKKLIQWVAKYLQDDRAAKLRALSSDEEDAPNIIYQNFDWTSSDAQFNAAVVRRKRRRLERQRSLPSNVNSPNLLSLGGGGSVLTTPQLNGGQNQGRLERRISGSNTYGITASRLQDGEQISALTPNPMVGEPRLPNDSTYYSMGYNLTVPNKREGVDDVLTPRSDAQQSFRRQSGVDARGPTDSSGFSGVDEWNRGVGSHTSNSHEPAFETSQARPRIELVDKSGQKSTGAD